jgi:hypothetical protein
MLSGAYFKPTVIRNGAGAYLFVEASLSYSRSIEIAISGSVTQG